ncbi:MAG: LysM peptidoglycan-binding domain-containing protein [Flavobacteriaceae bacterium]|nr:LysM peptidoglycan-binding domain-containing protein [Flavobacteriaceae bacterium]
MFKRVIFILVLVFTSSLFGQNYTKHIVLKGETITQIALKYKVSPLDIYNLNPDAQSGVKLNSVLLIPVSKLKAPAVSSINGKQKIHEVLAKETVYSISNLYAVSVEDIQIINKDGLKEGLKIGQMLVIPSKSTLKLAVKTNVKASDKIIYHEVLPKETKYAIANKYTLTVEQLEQLNPEIISGLPIGYKLIVSGIINKFISKEQPEVAITSKSIKIEDIVKSNKVFSKLTKSSTSQNAKQLVLLLPFNILKIENDSLNSVASKLKKDKFLNMTLDFYSGVLMAIDSAKVIGLNVNVRILDSEETKNSSAITKLVQQNNLQNADAIIGPFYQTNVEKLAELVSSNNVPVISPLSKEIGKSIPNLYQSMPSNDDSKAAILDYIYKKNGNIVAVIDAKKTTLKDFFIKSKKGIKIVGFNEKGSIAKDSLKKLFLKNKMNYVVLDSQKTNVILAVTNAMLVLMPEYQVQLVILEANSTLDFDEIDLSRLTKLKMLYPSIVRENSTREADIFRNDFKKVNKVFPNQFAIRGFDLTFDTLLRLSQDKNYQETSENVATEQIENKFSYSKNSVESYSNKGIYILYYDTDLTIKQAE